MMDMRQTPHACNTSCLQPRKATYRLRHIAARHRHRQPVEQQPVQTHTPCSVQQATHVQARTQRHPRRASVRCWASFWPEYRDTYKPEQFAPDRSPSQRSPSPAASPSDDPLASVEGLQSEEEVEADMASAESTTHLWELLSSSEQSNIFGNRARSATDANVLRRKGHLKEQDFLIDFMRRMHDTHTCLEVMTKMEKWAQEHRKDPHRSRLKRLVPQLGLFHTELPLVDAFHEYDEVFKLSRRKFIPPNFAELRHVVNIAQIHASARQLKLITFDADGTLYADGCHFEQDNAMIAHIINLLQCGVHVGIVTAAGYPGEAQKFEGRLAGLLGSFRSLHLPPSVVNRFHVMGGECNYLLRVTPEYRLEFVPDEAWKTEEMMRWSEDDIQYMLDGAEMLLTKGAKRLELPVSILRKPRSVGIIPTVPTIYEVLEDIALSAQTQLVANMPFCAFNGGNDVFVDVGNKSLGLGALMGFLGIQPHETLHVGDRFTLSGNDSATRDMCSVLWVADPNETGFFVRLLLKDIGQSRLEAQRKRRCSSRKRLQ